MNRKVVKIILFLLGALALTGAIVGFIAGIAGYYTQGNVFYEMFVHTDDDWRWESFTFNQFTRRLLGIAIPYTTFLIIGSVCLLVAAAVIILLCVFVGRYADGENRGILLRLPYLFPLFAQGFLVTLGWAVTFELAEAWFDQNIFDRVVLVLVVLSLFVTVVLTLWSVLHLIARLKTKEFWKNTMVYICLRFCWRILRGICRGCATAIRKWPLYWHAAVACGILFFVEFIGMVVMVENSWDEGLAVMMFFLWFIKTVTIAAFVIGITLNLRKLQKAGENLAEGHLHDKVETKNLIGPFRTFGDTLNRINEGITKAVGEQIKSERMRTELITNVSHDIKTPLTSIINYIDLMKQHGTEDETLREYEEVLSRQSARLRKLIEDLIEASKASTGNLTVTMADTEVGILLDQALAEFEERLAASEIDVVLKKPEQPLTISADGKYLWRVFDNLLINVVKYGMPRTRVYIDLLQLDGMCVIMFKNISRFQLDISGDELMERFTRGDKSRHTEGNGLGLSIAKSLVELQNGSLDIVVDGDLFKVVMQFPVIVPVKEEKKTEEQE